jgi:formate/nitrite transporter
LWGYAASAATASSPAKNPADASPSAKQGTIEVVKLQTISSAVSPVAVVEEMVSKGAYKAARKARKIVIQAMLATFVFGSVTLLAGTVVVQTGVPFLGAVVFPIALVIVIMLGLELMTSSMGQVPLAQWRGKARKRDTPRTIGWAFLGHAIGCVIFVPIAWATVTEMGSQPDAPLAVWLREMAEHKTIHYQSLGIAAGIGLVFLRAVLCNWLVSMGAVMGMTSTQTGGSIMAIWLPIMVFFALGWEHSVVNLFVIPAGMVMGAEVGWSQWWLWNQIPVILGNFVGAAILTAGGLWLAHHGTMPWNKAGGPMQRASAS